MANSTKSFRAPSATSGAKEASAPAPCEAPSRRKEPICRVQRVARTRGKCLVSSKKYFQLFNGLDGFCPTPSATLAGKNENRDTKKTLGRSQSDASIQSCLGQML